MGLKPKKIIFLIPLVLFIFSCTIQKREYFRGHQVQWTHKKIKPAHTQPSSQTCKLNSVKQKGDCISKSEPQAEAPVSGTKLKIHSNNAFPLNLAEKIIHLKNNNISKANISSHNFYSSKKGICSSRTVVKHSEIEDRDLKKENNEPKEKKTWKKLVWGIVITVLLGLFIVGGAYYPDVYAVCLGLSTILSPFFPPEPSTRKSKISRKQSYLLTILFFILLTLMYAWFYFFMMAVLPAILIQTAVIGTYILVGYLLEEK